MFFKFKCAGFPVVPLTYHKILNQVVAIATAALEGFRNEAKKMVVALVDMERAFVPPQHFIRLVQRRYAKCKMDERLFILYFY